MLTVADVGSITVTVSLWHRLSSDWFHDLSSEGTSLLDHPVHG